MKQRRLKSRRLNAHRRGLVAARLATLEAEVARGERDARSLVVFSPEFVRATKVTFPNSPFGEPRDWLDEE
jgi:hypothetical protein